MADRIKSLRKVERYYDNIWIGLKQVGDGVEKEDDGSRRRTGGAKGELIRKVETRD